jgi:large subunit ribosomal protein L28
MAKYCEITGKSTLVAGGYSNRVRATKFQPTGKVRRRANLHKKTYFVPELGKSMTITVSARGMKTITKKGVYKAFKDAGLITA